MTKTFSFSNHEKKSMQEMRNKLNHAEDKIDLENKFSYTVTGFLKEVFYEKDINIKMDDIFFTPDKRYYYSIRPELQKSDIFRQTWDNSDLPNAIKRFAGATYHRYLHLNKHPEKTEKKLRN